MKQNVCGLIARFHRSRHRCETPHDDGRETGVTQHDLMLNERTHRLRPMSQSAAQFHTLAPKEQSEDLLLLRHHHVQTRAPTENGPEDVHRTGLHPTHTPAVPITHGPTDNQPEKTTSPNPPRQTPEDLPAAQDDQVAATITRDLLKRPQDAAKVPTKDKARVVKEFTRDETATAAAATNLLRRPDVAFKAMSDDTAPSQVNHAQAERSRQARDTFERTSPVAPAVRHVDRTTEFLDLVTACHAFIAAAGRTVPGLRDRTLADDERTIVHQNIAKVRATLGRFETAVDTGKIDMDDELTHLLRGE
jgi:hypothetical protein